MAMHLTYILRTPTGRPDATGKKSGPPAYFIGPSLSAWDRDQKYARRFSTWNEADDERQKFMDLVEARLTKAQIRMAQIEIVEVDGP